MAATLYQVKDWDAHYENYKSRERDQCSFVCVPNKFGLGLSHLLSLKDGAAYLGIFLLIIEALSRQRKPREGYCTDDGKKNGRPWSPADISIMVRRPEPEVTAALDALLNDKVGWLTELQSEYPPSTRRVPVTHPGMEGKEGKEVKGKKVAADAAGHGTRNIDSGPHARFVKAFCDAWKKSHHGATYQVQGAKDGSAVGRILKACGDDHSLELRIIADFVSAVDPFLIKRGHTIADLAGNVNFFVSQAARAAQGHGTNGRSNPQIPVFRPGAGKVPREPALDGNAA